MDYNTNIDRERVGLTFKEVTDAWGGNGGALATDNPLNNPVTSDTSDDVPPTNGANQVPITPPPVRDNTLLIFGGLAAFYLIALAPFKGSVSGPGTPSAKWFLPAAGLGGLIAWQIHKQRVKIAEYREYLQGWIKSLQDASQVPAGLEGIAKMSTDEICDLYVIVHDYFNANKPITDAALQARYNDLVSRYLPMLS